jgi:hypothetical protein
MESCTNFQRQVALAILCFELKLFSN